MGKNGEKVGYIGKRGEKVRRGKVGKARKIIWNDGELRREK